MTTTDAEANTWGEPVSEEVAARLALRWRRETMAFGVLATLLGVVLLATKVLELSMPGETPVWVLVVRVALMVLDAVLVFVGARILWQSVRGVDPDEAAGVE